MAEKLTAVKGMNDLLPPQSARWQWLEEKIAALMARYGYALLRTPIVEPTALYVRGLGEVTDIVEKEMYAFEDSMNGDKLALRPEGTAGIVRAMIEHNTLYNGPVRGWTIGPMFRHERPQKGRYRQFHQLDVEALGFAGPDVDAELILMVRALWRELGLVEGRDVKLQLNSLGQPAERHAHRTALIAHFEAHADALDAEGKRRLHGNPLRLLDSKAPAMQPVVEAAPKLIDFLGADSIAHLDGVRAVLDAAGLPYTINPRLVRGMDYYNLTVFEWVTDRLGSQGTICGGGRYDGLFEQLGGKPTPAVGFASGLERVVLLLEELGLVPDAPRPDVYAIVPDAAALPRVLPVLETLRAAGVSVLMHAATKEGQGSMKSQFKRADASGAVHALVFGTDELAAGQVALKPLRAGPGDAAQSTRALADAAVWAPELRNR
jgi:histidyl-tRNA synthetase